MYRIEFYDNQLCSYYSIYSTSESDMKREVAELSATMQSKHLDHDVVVQVPRYSNIHVWYKIQ